MLFLWNEEIEYQSIENSGKNKNKKEKLFKQLKQTHVGVTLNKTARIKNVSVTNQNEVTQKRNKTKPNKIILHENSNMSHQ